MRAWLEHRWATRVIVAITFLLTLPTLAVGFFADDYVLRDSLHGLAPYSPPWYDLYWFMPGTIAGNRAAMHAGQIAWWTAPEIKVHFFRPLSSALLAIDDRLFGDASVFWHLHSIAWYLALVVAVAGLYRRLLPRASATVAVFLFAVCDSHLHPYGWPSARHATISALAGVLALHAYLRDCEDGWARGRWLAALGLFVGLAAGETALELVLFAGAYALLAPVKPAKNGARDRRARLAAGLPALAVVAAYVVVYKLHGCGVAHSGEYFDPMTSPIAFAFAAFTRVPLFVANAVLSIPVELGVVFPAGPLVAIAVVVTLMTAFLYRACAPAIPDEERAVLRWIVPGGALALLPGVGGFPGARLLLVPNIGFAVLFALLLPRAFARIAGEGSFVLAARRTWGGLLAAIHFGFAPLLMILGALTGAKMARASEAVAYGADLGDVPHVRALVLAASDPTVGIYPPALLAAARTERTSCWANLSAAKARHLVTRTGASTFMLEPIGTTLLQTAFEKLYRPDDERLAVGDGGEACGATIRVTALRDGWPSRIEVDVGVPLESPEVRFLEWKDGALRRWIPPAIGERSELPWSPGPMVLF